jgi:hypothetical protein
LTVETEDNESRALAAWTFFALFALVYSSILEGEGKSELEISSSSSLTVEGAEGLLSWEGVDELLAGLPVERLDAVSQVC